MADDLTRIGEDVAETLGALPTQEGPFADSFLPEIVLRAQADLAAMSEVDLLRLFSDVSVAIALRVGGTMTPRRVFAEFGERCKIGDEAFLDKTAPELRRVLAKLG